MKIKKIQLKNSYKRFHDLTIDLGENPKRIIALVGPNGCGKSSVFDAFLYRNNTLSIRIIGDRTLMPKGAYYHTHLDISYFDYENIQIDFVEGDFNEVRERKKTSGKDNTIFSFRSSYRYNVDLNVKELKAIDDIKLNSYGAATSSDIDAKIEQNYRKLNTVFNKHMKENPDTATYNSTRKKIIDELNLSLKECLDLEISSVGDIENSNGSLYFKKADQPHEFAFNVLSAGEKEVVDLLLDLYLRKEEYNDTVFLIDEPELHINTSIQRKLLIEINKLVGENCQIWLATHSIGLLRALQDELKDECQIISFPKDTEWASTVQCLTPMEKSIENWKQIFGIALDDLSGLISPKRIIFCEGRDTPGHKGKEKGLDAQVFNNIFGAKYHDTLFVSSGGNTEPSQRSQIAIAILTKALPDLEIWVFNDKDISSGKKTTEADRQIYLDNNNDTHRIMQRWEIENYLFDKEVLKAYCAAHNLSFAENEYDNLVNDIYDDHLKDEFNKIKNYCNITTPINPETFKIQLSKYIKEEMAVYKELEKAIFKRK